MQAANFVPGRKAATAPQQSRTQQLKASSPECFYVITNCPLFHGPLLLLSRKDFDDFVFKQKEQHAASNSTSRFESILEFKSFSEAGAAIQYMQQCKQNGGSGSASQITKEAQRPKLSPPQRKQKQKQLSVPLTATAKKRKADSISPTVRKISRPKKSLPITRNQPAPAKHQVAPPIPTIIPPTPQAAPKRSKVAVRAAAQLKSPPPAAIKPGLVTNVQKASLNVAAPDLDDDGSGEDDDDDELGLGENGLYNVFHSKDEFKEWKEDFGHNLEAVRAYKARYGHLNISHINPNGLPAKSPYIPIDERELISWIDDTRRVFHDYKKSALFKRIHPDLLDLHGEFLSLGIGLELPTLKGTRDLMNLIAFQAKMQEEQAQKTTRAAASANKIKKAAEKAAAKAAAKNTATPVSGTKQSTKRRKELQTIDLDVKPKEPRLVDILYSRGFSWQQRAKIMLIREWNDSFPKYWVQLLEFKSKHGHCNVPKEEKYVTDMDQEEDEKGTSSNINNEIDGSQDQPVTNDAGQKGPPTPDDQNQSPVSDKPGDVGNTYTLCGRKRKPKKQYNKVVVYDDLTLREWMDETKKVLRQFTKRSRDIAILQEEKAKLVDQSSIAEDQEEISPSHENAQNNDIDNVNNCTIRVASPIPQEPSGEELYQEDDPWWIDVDGKKLRVLYYRSGRHGMKKMPPPSEEAMFNETYIEEIKAKFKKLNELGFYGRDKKKSAVLKSTEDEWNSQFKVLLKFRADYGGVGPHIADSYSRSVSVIFDAWLRKLRHDIKDMKAGRPSDLTPEYRAKIEGAGLSLEDFLKPTETMTDEVWETYLDGLKAFKASHGHIVVPHNKRSGKLGEWILRQKLEYGAYRKGLPSEMTAARLQRLKDVGLHLKMRKRWDDRAAEYLEYITQHKRDPPRGEISGLGKWVSLQRIVYHRLKNGLPNTNGPTLTPPRIAKLTSWGFDWREDNPPVCNKMRPRTPWDKKIEMYKDYILTTGKRSVPQNHPELGDWVKRQRRSTRYYLEGQPSSITPERLKTLQDLGFDFGNYRGSSVSAPKSHAAGEFRNSDNDDSDDSDSDESDGQDNVSPSSNARKEEGTVLLKNDFRAQPEADWVPGTYTYATTCTTNNTNAGDDSTTGGHTQFV